MSNWREESERRFTPEQLNKARQHLDHLCKEIGPVAAADYRARIEETRYGDHPEFIESLIRGQTPGVPGLANPRAGGGKVW